MAISFETVTGNQTSANVLAQINNNFAKIKDGSVSKADYATNADTVDSKHASDLIPGAATFLNSITSLANLSVGRYFCTQTRQSWEPVTTTGSRTFLIEVSLNTPNNLKNYKINYIAGAGAGESYYSDYSSGSIRWNRIINNNNVGSVDAITSTYDYVGRKGKIKVSDGMVIFNEDKILENNGFIPVNDGTGNFYVITSSSVQESYKPSESCNSGYYILKIIPKVQIYNSSYQLISTISNVTSYYTYANHGSSSEGGSVQAVYINTDTGDAILGLTTTKGNHPDGYYYFSKEASKIFYIAFSQGYYDYSSSFDWYAPDYWENNHFGKIVRGSDRSSSSYYTDITNFYVDLSADRGSVVANSSSVMVSDGYYYHLIGQKNSYFYLVTNSSNYTSTPTLTRYHIPTKATNGVNINFASTYNNYNSSASTDYCDMDDDYIYIGANAQTGNNTYKKAIFKYNLSLSLISKSPEFSDNSYQPTGLLVTNNYVIIESNSVLRSYKKSGLTLAATFSGTLGNLSRNSNTNRRWFKNKGKNLQGTNNPGIYIKEDYFLGDRVSISFGNTDVSCYKIINAANGSVFGYFGNYYLYHLNNVSSTTPMYYDNIGLLFNGALLNTQNLEILLRSFVVG